jgi:hypothetical protein
VKSHKWAPNGVAEITACRKAQRKFFALCYTNFRFTVDTKESLVRKAGQGKFDGIVLSYIQKMMDEYIRRIKKVRPSERIFAALYLLNLRVKYIVFHEFKRKLRDGKLDSNIVFGLYLTQMSKSLRRAFGIIPISDPQDSKNTKEYATYVNTVFGPKEEYVTRKFDRADFNERYKKYVKSKGKKVVMDESLRRYFARCASTGPVKPSHNVYCVGRVYSRCGGPPEKFSKHDTSFCKFLVDKQISTKFKFAQEAVNPRGSASTISHVLNNCSKYDQAVSKFTVKDSMLDIEIFGNLLKFKSIKAPARESLYTVRYNPVAYCGFDSERLAGRNKKQAFEIGIQAAMHAYDNITRHPRKVKSWYVPSIFKMTGRPKKQIREVGELIKARPVWMPEISQTLLDSMFSQPFGEMLKSSVAEGGSVGIGFTGMKGQYNELYNRFQSCEAVRSADFRDYDTTVPKLLIIHAFGIVSAAFPLKCMQYIVACAINFLKKYVVTTTGYVYCCETGIPSGSPWTSIIGSLCNFLIQAGTLRRLCVKHKFKPSSKHFEIAVYGDDNLVGFKNLKHTFTTSEYNAKLEEVYGMFLKPGMSFGEFDTGDIDTCVDYLSVKYVNGMPCRTADDVFLSFVFAKRFVDGSDAVVGQRKNFIGYAPGNFELFDIMKEFFVTRGGFDEISRDFKEEILESYITQSLIIWNSRYVPSELERVARYREKSTVRYDWVNDGFVSKIDPEAEWFRYGLFELPTFDYLQLMRYGNSFSIPLSVLKSRCGSSLTTKERQVLYS